MLAIKNLDGETVFIKAKAINAVLPSNRNMPFPTGAVLYGPEIIGLTVDLAGFVAALNGTPKMIELINLRGERFWLNADTVTTVMPPMPHEKGAAHIVCGGHPYLVQETVDAVAQLVG